MAGRSPRKVVVPRATHRSRSLAAVAAVLAVAALITVVPAAERATASPPPGTVLPLGSVVITSDSDPQLTSPSPCNGDECHKFEITCPGVAAKAVGWYWVQRPTVAPRGAVVFFSGGGGDFYWSREKRSAGFLITRLLSDGFIVMQVRWGQAWENTSPGEIAGASVACRPATIIDYLHDTEYATEPGLVEPPGVGICGFCIGGPSGGSSQVAYALSHFGLDTELDGVFPISGPTHAAVEKGCIPDRRFAVQFRYDGPSTRRIDGPLGYSAGSGPYADTNGPCRLSDPSWAAEFRALGIDTGGADYEHPATRVHVLMGQLDKIMRAHAGDYVRRLAEGGPTPGDADASPFVGFELIPGMPHGITEYNPGGGNTTLEDYPGLVALHDDLVQLDPAKLTACNNGFDDDGDGTVDFAGGAGDPGCASAVDAGEQSHPGEGLVGPACDNGQDDDADGRVDYATDDFGDPGCFGPTDSGERVPYLSSNLWCDDGVDNDGDGRVDFPDDPGCTSAADIAPAPDDPPGPMKNAEKQPAGLGFPAVICDDGIDNDGDGFTDFLAAGGGDPDCSTPASASEFPTVSISQPADISEAGGQLSFDVSITSVPASPVTVSYATGGGSATAGADYTSTSGQLTFATATTQTVNVPVLQDALDELDRETFTMSLTLVSGPGAIGKGSATGAILDDDPMPALSVSAGPPLAEGNTGQKPFRFTVTLSPVGGRDVSVGFATSNGSAVAGPDYVAQSGTLSFPAGQISKTVDVQIVGDATVEPDETFFLVLSNPVNATLGVSSSTATIQNDDSAGTVTISIADASLTEPDAGANGKMKVKVTLSGPSTQTVTVRFDTADGTATGGSDYKKKGGTVTFSPGQTSKTVQIVVVGDGAVEGNETFFVNLTNPVGATILDAQGLYTINNDD
jgi:hypothetical protein